MPQKNQTTNENHDQQGINETQIPESRSIENRRGDGEISEGSSEVANSETSATIASSNLSTEKEADELNTQTKNIQTPQSEGDQPARRGPTGPRTERGKQRSSRNAVKFGIFSRATLIKGESRAVYQSLLEGFWEALQPVGKVEELLVEKLVSYSWRRQRCLVAEGATIRKASEFLEFDRRWKEQVEAEAINLRLQAGSMVDVGLEPVGLIWGIYNPDILKRCIVLLVAI
jgi:hypothetical protein